MIFLDQAVGVLVMVFQKSLMEQADISSTLLSIDFQVSTESQ